MNRLYADAADCLYFAFVFRFLACCSRTSQLQAPRRPTKPSTNQQPVVKCFKDDDYSQIESFSSFTFRALQLVCLSPLSLPPGPSFCSQWVFYIMHILNYSLCFIHFSLCTGRLIGRELVGEKVKKGF